MALSLMEILVECENTLGWIPNVPKGQTIFHARARMHRILSRSMAQRRISVEDLGLALAYCQRRRHPISTPAELLPLVKEARTLAAPAKHLSSLDVRQGEALAWEHQRLDDDSPYWIGRIVRSLNTGLEDVLTEWAGAGRG